MFQSPVARQPEADGGFLCDRGEQGVAGDLPEQVAQLGKAQLPLDDLFARDGPPVLQLVTCAGDFDPAAGAYEDNLIVTATPVAP